MTRTELLAFWPDTVSVGLRLPIGVEGRELDVAVALARELDDALDVVLGQLGLAGRDDLAAQPRVLLGIEARRSPSRQARMMALRCRLASLRARDQRGDLLLLEHLPGDELLDVGMVDVDRRPSWPRAASCRPT